MNVVQLEAFESSLKGKRICWFVNSSAKSLPQYPPGFSEQIFTESPPFQRNILVTGPKSSEAWKLVDKWDITYSVSSASDWSILLTIILYQPNSEHVLVVFTPEAKPPPTFFQKLQQQTKPGKASTLMCLDYLQAPLQPFPITFDAIFFPGSQHLDDSSLQIIQNLIQTLVSTETPRVSDSIKELRSVGAGLVISSIESVRRIYTLYWYYATESSQKNDSLLQQVLHATLKRGTFT